MANMPPTIAEAPNTNGRATAVISAMYGFKNRRMPRITLKAPSMPDPQPPPLKASTTREIPMMMPSAAMTMIRMVGTIMALQSGCCIMMKPATIPRIPLTSFQNRPGESVNMDTMAKTPGDKPVYPQELDQYDYGRRRHRYQQDAYD
jgi:hypothetical protein